MKQTPVSNCFDNEYIHEVDDMQKKILVKWGIYN